MPSAKSIQFLQPDSGESVSTSYTDGCALDKCDPNCALLNNSGNGAK
jgi:hypothetical protein